MKPFRYIAIAFLLVPTAFAAAQAPNTTDAVTIATLGVEKPAFIVSNPLYGITDTLRGVMNDSFTYGKLNKLSARIDLLNRKAAELLRMRQVAPDNAKLISKAIAEYRLAVYQYAITAGKVTAADITADSRGSQLTQNLVLATMLHLRLIDELLAASTTTADQAVLGEVLERFSDANLKLFNEAIGFNSVRLRLASLPSTGPLTEVRTAEMLSLLAKRAATLGNANSAQELLTMRANLLDSIVTRLIATAPMVPATQQISAKVVQVASLAINSEVVPSNLDEEAVISLSQLAGSKAERAQTLSYLLSQPQLLQNESLTALRNGLLMEVFAK